MIPPPSPIAVERDAAETGSAGVSEFSFVRGDRDARQSATLRITFMAECRRGLAVERLISVEMKPGISLSSSPETSSVNGGGTYETIGS